MVNFESVLWHRVMAATAPRVAAADPFYGEQAAGDRTMRADGLHRVLRTSGSEPAAAGRTKEKKLCRRNRPAIRADGEHQQVFWNIQHPTSDIQRPMARSNHPWMFNVGCWVFDVFHFSNFARFNAVRKSFSTSANVRPAIEFRATRMISTGCASSY